MSRTRDILQMPDLGWTGVMAGLSLVALIGWKSGAAVGPAILAFAFVVAAAVFRPRAGLYLVILTAPIRGTLLLAGDGLSATRLLGAAVAVGAVVLWSREARLPRVGWGAVPLIALAVLGATSILPEVDSSSALAAAGLAQYVLLAVIVADATSTPRGAVRLCLVVGASALMTALMMLGDYVPFAIAARSMEPTRFEWAVDPQPTLLATFLATGILALFVVDSENVGRRWRLALAGMGAPLILAVLALNSRLAAIALVLGVFAFALAGKGIRRRLPLAAGFTATAVVLAVLTGVAGLWDPGMRYRATHTLDSPYEATSGRTVIWKVGAQVFADHPIRGVGLSRFPDHFEAIRTSTDLPLRSKPSRTPHSDYIGLAAEVGVLGPILLLAALVLTALPLLRRGSSALAPAVFGWLAMLALWMVGLDMTTQWQTWVGLGVALGIGRGPD